MTDIVDELLDGEEPEQQRRGRGRPSNAELEAREKALKDREEEIALREREAELHLAEANAALREIDLNKAEQKIADTRVAAARTAQMRGDGIRSATVTEPARGRRYRGAEMPNEFHIPEEDVPDGMSYQWNNYTVFGMQNPQYDSYMAMQGWTPVPADRHPHLVPVGHKGHIVVKGQILMERPVEYTREALQEEYEKAVGEVRAKEQQMYGTPAGQLPRARDNGTAEFNRVKKDFEPGVPVAPSYDYGAAATGPVIE